jgi:Kinesin motor domain
VSQRAVAATQMNAASSRSHAVFTIYLNLRRRVTIQGDEPLNESPIARAETLVEAKFHLADLAGSLDVPALKESIDAASLWTCGEALPWLNVR